MCPITGWAGQLCMAEHASFKGDPQRRNNNLPLPGIRMVHDPLSRGEHWHCTTEPTKKVLHTLEIKLVEDLIPTKRVLPPRPHQYEPHVKHGLHQHLQNVMLRVPV